ncbi:hypothetical protein KC356_g161 [Hortaea werneckii]|nr:hypothetical protein KC356_g161 [Hortaea werneckii]
MALEANPDLSAEDMNLAADMFAGGEAQGELRKAREHLMKSHFGTIKARSCRVINIATASSDSSMKLKSRCHRIVRSIGYLILMSFMYHVRS